MPYRRFGDEGQRPEKVNFTLVVDHHFAADLAQRDAPRSVCDSSNDSKDSKDSKDSESRATAASSITSSEVSSQKKVQSLLVTREAATLRAISPLQDVLHKVILMVRYPCHIIDERLDVSSF